MAYPDEVDEFRTLENRADVQYDPTQSRRVYAEDITNTQTSIQATQQTLGENPDLGYGTVGNAIDESLALGNDGVDRANSAQDTADEALYLGDDAHAIANDANGMANNALNIAHEALDLANTLQDQVNYNTNAIDELWAAVF